MFSQISLVRLMLSQLSTAQEVQKSVNLLQMRIMRFWKTSQVEYKSAKLKNSSVTNSKLARLLLYWAK